MRHEGFDIQSIDVKSLNPAQRDALKRHLVRHAQAARTQAIRRAVARAVGLPCRLRPAMVVQTICEVTGKVWAAHVRRRDRWECLAQLRAMTDHELRDIGLSRSEIGATVFSDEPRH
jgi:uncharacterized protein YjiS (DUF1127 family)